MLFFAAGTAGRTYPASACLTIFIREGGHILRQRYMVKRKSRAKSLYFGTREVSLFVLVFISLTESGTYRRRNPNGKGITHPVPDRLKIVRRKLRPASQF
jgi:hypothetical protein